jgi:CDP-diacylglycerol--inositol 3-phosphatidyltransferase
MASVQTQTNGNGTPVRPAQAEQEGAKENIFLFIPNLIGMRVPAILLQSS